MLQFIKGDTGRFAKLDDFIMDGSNPVDLTAFSSVDFRMVLASDHSIVVCDDVTTGVTVHPTQNFIAAVTSNLITCNGHGLVPGNQIVVSTSGTLPTGLAASTRYFPIEIGANSFKLAETENGSPIDITGAGSGTHAFYMVGSVRKQFVAAEVDTVGVYDTQWILYETADISTVPRKELSRQIEIVDNTR